MRNLGFRAVLVALAGGMLLGGCSENKRYQDGVAASRYVSYSLTLRDGEQQSEGTAGQLPEMSVFQFSNGEFYLKQQVRPDAQGTVSLPAMKASRLYFVCGVPFSLSGETIDEEHFRRISIGRDLHDNTAPEFMTAVVDLDEAETRAGGSTVVSLKRSVARIDLNTTADKQIRIREVVIKDAPAEIYPFLEGTPVSDETVTYRKVFDGEGVEGEQAGVFRLFESPRPVHVRVLGTYKEAPLQLDMELPTVERNKVYELEVRNAGATVEGTVEVKPWDEGGTVVGSPDAGNRILIDAARSTIPTGVQVDYDRNLVEVPAEGATGMTLAFVGESRIDIDQVEGLGDDVNLGNMELEETPAGFVSTFDISVAPQGKGRLGYSVLVHLKSPWMQESYDYVEIRVAPSDHQIETVEIGGATWMAFNARSRKLDDQVYPLDGMTVEEMYRDSWINTVGGLFQFGRMYMYVPWKGYNPSNDLGHQGTANAPWTNDAYMPCPEGYRVPTRAEWKSILPASAQIPGSYTAGNGEQITATLHVANGTLVTPTGVGGTQRYVKLVSDATGNTLFIPMAGYKGDKSTSNNPDFGNWALMWTNDRTGCPGGYAWLRRLRFNAATNSLSTIDEYQWQMEGFAYVRCVKK